jgi:4-hydroxy-2-oxoheptanedioate aldolase
MSLAFFPLRPALRQKRVVHGVFCELPCPETVEIIGLAGWDFVVIDCEHAPITAAQLPGMIRAATAAGIPAIVRVAANEPAAIQHALDAGASGVQIPQIASVAAATAAVAASRFHPLGARGVNPFVRAANFSATPMQEFFDRANNEVAVVLQLESAAGIAAAEEILELDGIDVLFIGPYDLSQSLGIPGQTSDPKIFGAAERIVKSAERRNVAVGVFTNAEQDAQRWLDSGIRYLCLSVDTVFLFNAMRATVAKLRPPDTK